MNDTKLSKVGVRFDSFSLFSTFWHFWKLQQTRQESSYRPCWLNLCKLMSWISALFLGIAPGLQHYLSEVSQGIWSLSLAQGLCIWDCPSSAAELWGQVVEKFLFWKKQGAVCGWPGTTSMPSRHCHSFLWTQVALYNINCETQIEGTLCCRQSPCFSAAWKYAEQYLA